MLSGTLRNVGRRRSRGEGGEAVAREPRKDARSRGRSRKVTLVDVAREASCSVSLASIVMRDAAGASQETRRRVKAVAARLGYRPDQRARALQSAHSGLIGVTFGVHAVDRKSVV